MNQLLNKLDFWYNTFPVTGGYLISLDLEYPHINRAWQFDPRSNQSYQVNINGIAYTLPIE